MKIDLKRYCDYLIIDILYKIIENYKKTEDFEFKKSEWISPLWVEGGPDYIKINSI